MLETADIVALPKGQAFVLTEGAKLYKVRFPLPDADDDLPESLAEIAQDMKNSYSRVTPENWYKPHDNWYQLSPVLSGDLNSDSDAPYEETGDSGNEAATVGDAPVHAEFEGVTV